MSIVVFAGPSLFPSTDVAFLSRVELEAPARCGDVYRAVQRGARVIGLIDGYFDHALSVWHKEILWALSKGVRVYGAASMGALRAAELGRYGMVGVGRIFEQFSSGVLEDDDEVTVVHEPSERGYRAQSEAMVNLRATLEAAARVNALSAEAAGELTAALKGLFYPARDFLALKRLASTKLPASELSRFSAWLEATGVVNAKRADALALLERMERDLADPELPSVPAFRFADTDAWRTLRARIDGEERPRTQASRAVQGPSPHAGLRADSLLDALEPSVARHVVQLAAERALALCLAESAGASVEELPMQAESEAFRRERGLLTPERTASWLASYGLDVRQFSELIHDNVLSKRFAAAAEALILRQVPAALIVVRAAGRQY